MEYKFKEHLWRSYLRAVYRRYLWLALASLNHANSTEKNINHHKTPLDFLSGEIIIFDLESFILKEYIYSFSIYSFPYQ